LKLSSSFLDSALRMIEPIKMASSVEPSKHVAPSSSQIHHIIGVAP